MATFRKDLSSRLVRWRLKLLEYKYEVIYKAGKINANADALSRNPVNAQLCPITKIFEISGLDESLFSHKTIQFPPDTPKETNTNPIAKAKQMGNGNESEDDRDDIETDSSDESNDEIFDNINVPYEFKANNVKEIGDNFATRKDHKAVFFTQKGDPCDPGAQCSQRQTNFPLFPLIHWEQHVLQRTKVRNLFAW